MVGDKVLILLLNKLLMQWKGLFKVEKTVGTNDYGIQVNGKVKTFHANMLKKYIERERLLKTSMVTRRNLKETVMVTTKTSAAQLFT